MEPILILLSLIPGVLFTGAILYALYYFFTGQHHRKDEPTYEFPKDEERAYKPILSATGLKEPKERDESSET